MDCPLQGKEGAELLLDYCSRTLDPDLTEIVNRHLAACPSCRALMEAQQAVWRALDAWEAPPIPADFDRRLFRRIREARAPGWLERLRLELSPINWRPALPLAAASVILAAGFLLQRPSIPPAAPAVETADVEQVERALEDLEMLKLFHPARVSDTSPGQTL